MPITFRCGACGRWIKAPNTAIGTSARCPSCKTTVLVPHPSGGSEEPEYSLTDPSPKESNPSRPAVSKAEFETPRSSSHESQESFQPADSRSHFDRARRVASRSSPVLRSDKNYLSAQRWLYWAFSLTLFPLVFSVYSAVANAESRLAKTLEKNPEIQKAIDSKAIQSFEDIFKHLPDHKIDGALLARDSWLHWWFAALSAAGFFTVILLFFNRGTPVAPASLLGVGLLVGTVGIILLLAFQYLADWTLGFNVHSRSVLVLLFYFVKFIGFSYRCALDSSNGFWLSFMGFTLGVGLCEELCKGLPMAIHFSSDARLDERGACVYGLACGAGFGIAEGIHYCSSNYNGIGEGSVYLVRFVSCVGLHAIWSGTAGILICRFQDSIQGELDWYEWLIALILILSVPMILHGLYDTLLKKDMEKWAVGVAFLSFACLVTLIEIAGRVSRTDE